MAPSRHQIIFIGGWEAFENEEAYLRFLEAEDYDPYVKYSNWKKWLADGLSDRFESFSPTMPAKQNAFYPAWKIWFEKLFPYLNDEKLIIIAHSLGGIFIAKYLSENAFPKRLAQLHLVAPVLDNEWLVGESIASFAFDTTKLSRLTEQSDEIHIWSSVDDPVVPCSHSERYHQAIENSILHTFDTRQHFWGQPSFVELFLEVGKVCN